MSERLVFTNVSDYFDDDDEEKDIYQANRVAESSSNKATRTPIASSGKSTAGSTYRPAYVPPIPMSAQTKRVVNSVDTSKICVGTLVKHKAFGIGQVKSVDGAIVVVMFKDVEKKFQFLGAFEQGFLELE